MIQSLTKYDFPNQTPVPDGYNMTSVPSISLDNFQVLIDKINELVTQVNNVTPFDEFEE